MAKTKTNDKDHYDRQFADVEQQLALIERGIEKMWQERREARNKGSARSAAMGTAVEAGS